MSGPSDAQRPGRWRERAIGGLLAIASVLATLFVADRTVGLVRGSVIKPVNELGMETGMNAVGTYLRPGFRSRYATAEYSITVEINEIGLRGPVPGPKEPGTFRILALGDSFTFGQGVEAEQAWPALVGSELRGDRMDVVNAGWAASSPAGQAEYLRSYGLGLGPDLVLAAIFVGNDIVDDLMVARAITGPVDQLELQARYVSGLNARVGPVGMLRQAFDSAFPNLYEVATLALVKAQYAVAGRRGQFDYILAVDQSDDLREGWSRTYAAMDTIADLAERHGGRAGFVIVPFHDQLRSAPGRSRFDPELPQKLVARHCEERGLRCLDLLPVLRAAGDAPALYHLKDGHWTVAGHRVAAREVTTWLRRAGMLR